jgi:hypothetical protein
MNDTNGTTLTLADCQVIAVVFGFHKVEEFLAFAMAQTQQERCVAWNPRKYARPRCRVYAVVQGGAEGTSVVSPSPAIVNASWRAGRR